MHVAGRAHRREITGRDLDLPVVEVDAATFSLSISAGQRLVTVERKRHEREHGEEHDDREDLILLVRAANEERGHTSHEAFAVPSRR